MPDQRLVAEYGPSCRDRYGNVDYTRYEKHDLIDKIMRTLFCLHNEGVVEMDISISAQLQTLFCCGMDRKEGAACQFIKQNKDELCPLNQGLEDEIIGLLALEEAEEQVLNGSRSVYDFSSPGQVVEELTEQDLAEENMVAAFWKYYGDNNVCGVWPDSPSEDLGELISMFGGVVRDYINDKSSRYLLN